MTTSELIKAIRLKLGLNQRELAEKIGVSKNRISEWEGGKQSIGLNRANQICETLGFDFCSIICKHLQSQSLDKSHKECLNNKEN